MSKMITKTKSKHWVDALFQNADELKSGNDNRDWIFEFLGWNKYGKRRGTKNHW